MTPLDKLLNIWTMSQKFHDNANDVKNNDQFRQATYYKFVYENKETK